MIIYYYYYNTKLSREVATLLAKPEFVLLRHLTVDSAVTGADQKFIL